MRAIASPLWVPWHLSRMRSASVLLIRFSPRTDALSFMETNYPVSLTALLFLSPPLPRPSKSAGFQGRLLHLSVPLSVSLCPILSPFLSSSFLLIQGVFRLPNIRPLFLSHSESSCFPQSRTSFQRSNRKC